MKIQRALFLLLIITLTATYTFIPSLWHTIDMALFKVFNSMLALGKPVAFFWALLNHKYHDWIVDAIYLAFVLFYILKTSTKTPLQKLFEILLVLCVIALTIGFINKMIFRDYWCIEAISPSLKTTSFYNLNTLITCFRTKIYAYSSFPGDHATTALLFCFLTYPLFSPPLRKLAGSYTLLIILPRLIVGAHNFSDICVGSLSISGLITLLVNPNRTFSYLYLQFSRRPLKTH